MGALLFDADGDGDNDLLVVSGGSFITADSTTFRARLYLNDGRGRFTLDPDALPGVATSGSGSRDRKSTRLNSSHRCISYAVFCLKKKKEKETEHTQEHH